MKFLILLLLCAGCAGSEAVAVKPMAPLPCPPAPVVPSCSDQLTVLDSDSLAKGFTCPSNSRLTFPSAYLHSDKVLVLCQCK